jgi:ABC-type glycerol-3-phosphate transport system substrate-binding protein
MLRFAAQSGLLSDISDLVERDLPELSSDYWMVPGSLDVADATYGLPFGLTQGAWAFNPALLEEADINVPADGFTIPALIEAAKRLTEADELQFGLWIGPQVRYWASLVVPAGGERRSLLTPDERDSYVHQDERRADYERMLAITLRHHAAPMVEELGLISGGATGGFLGGQIAMLCRDGSLASRAGGDVAWDFMPSPRHEATDAAWHWIDNRGHWVTANAADRGRSEAAFTLAAHMAGPETGALHAEFREFTPDHKLTSQGDRYLRTPPDSMQVLLTNTETGSGLGYGPPTWDQWSLEVTATTARRLQAERPLETAFDELQTVGRSILAGGPPTA